MAGCYLVMGDKTTCGGVIIEGDPTHTIMGIPVAREFDQVTCGRFIGIFSIVGGIVTDTINGRVPAGSQESQSTCPCQSLFIPSMITDTYTI
jgi:uncharacterized Zn-binding protein involved in type VI secretion